MRLTSWVNTHPFQLSHCAANQRQKGSYHAKSTLISRSSSRGLLMSRVVPFRLLVASLPTKQYVASTSLPILPNSKNVRQETRLKSERRLSLYRRPIQLCIATYFSSGGVGYGEGKGDTEADSGVRRESMHKQRCKEYRVFEDAT